MLLRRDLVTQIGDEGLVVGSFDLGGFLRQTVLGTKFAHDAKPCHVDALE